MDYNAEEEEIKSVADGFRLCNSDVAAFCRKIGSSRTHARGASEGIERNRATGNYIKVLSSPSRTSIYVLYLSNGGATNHLPAAYCTKQSYISSGAN